jgi:anti-sigma-K factor RskA
MSDRTPPDPTGDDELAELRALGRRVGIDADHPLEPLDAPPPGIWDRIASELDEQPAATPLRARPSRARQARWAVPLAIAAGIAVIAGFVVLGGDDAQEPVLVATATLDPLAGSGSGTAELLDTDGHLQLRVETDDLDAGDGFLEVWVIDSGVERLVSLGPVRADDLYDLPTGLDPRDFPIVDVSVEPIDGNPTHSGNSLLRGQLEEV